MEECRYWWVMHPRVNLDTYHIIIYIRSVTLWSRKVKLTAKEQFIVSSITTQKFVYTLTDLSEIL